MLEDVNVGSNGGKLSERAHTIHHAQTRAQDWHKRNVRRGDAGRSVRKAQWGFILNIEQEISPIHLCL